MSPSHHRLSVDQFFHALALDFNRLGLVLVVRVSTPATTSAVVVFVIMSMTLRSQKPERNQKNTSTVIFNLPMVPALAA